AGHRDLGGAAVATVARDLDARRVDHGEHEARQELGELVVAVRAVAAGAPQVGVHERAAERDVDAAERRLARILGVDPGVGDHQADLVVLEQKVADPADRMRPTDGLVERADPLRAGVRRRVTTAAECPEHGDGDDRGEPLPPYPTGMPSAKGAWVPRARSIAL